MAAWCAARTVDEVLAAFTGSRRRGRPGDGHGRHRRRPALRRPPGRSPTSTARRCRALIARLSATPGALRWAGRPLDADGDDIRANGWAPPAGS